MQVNNTYASQPICVLPPFTGQGEQIPESSFSSHRTVTMHSGQSIKLGSHMTSWG